MLIEILQIVAGSWPLATMVSVGIVGFVIRRTISQSMEEKAEYRARNAIVVREREG